MNFHTTKLIFVYRELFHTVINMQYSVPATSKHSDYRTYSSGRKVDEREDKFGEFGGRDHEKYGRQESVGGGLEVMAMCTMCSCVCIAALVYTYYYLKMDKYI